MGVQKLSAITTAGAGPNPTDTIIGVSGGNADLQWTITQAFTSVIAGGFASIVLDSLTSVVQSIGTTSKWAYSGIVYGGGTSGNTLGFAKTRGATPTTQTAVQAGDQILGITAYGSDGTSFVPTSALQFLVNGAVTTGNVPTRFDLNTGSSGYGATRLRVDDVGNVQVISGTLGYGTGAGGTVTQITSRTTAVVLSNICGAITLFAAAPVVGTWVTFTVTNTLVAATDVIVVSVKSGTNTYVALVSVVAAGSFNISFMSIAGTASDSPVINFAVIKAVTA